MLTVELGSLQMMHPDWNSKTGVYVNMTHELEQRTTTFAGVRILQADSDDNA